MFGHRRVSLDASLFERVSGVGEVYLGAYPEAVLAVTGVLRLESVPRDPDNPSSFYRLGVQARNEAMRAALDGLISDGTVGLAAGTTVKAAVTAARAGKLPVTGELGELCRVIPGIRRFRSGIEVDLEVLEGHEVAEMPPALPPPGVEFGYAVPFGAATAAILLLERPDFGAGVRSYTLRPLQAEVNRIADFLFCDARPGGVLARKLSLHADAHVIFRNKRGIVTADHSLTRSQGEERAVGTLIVGGVTIFGKMKDKQTDINPSRTEFVNAMVAQFVNGTARMSKLGPPQVRAKDAR